MEEIYQTINVILNYQQIIKDKNPDFSYEEYLKAIKKYTQFNEFVNSKHNDIIIHNTFDQQDINLIEFLKKHNFSTRTINALKVYFPITYFKKITIENINIKCFITLFNNSSDDKYRYFERFKSVRNVSENEMKRMFKLFYDNGYKEFLLSITPQYALDIFD